jgi:hypothetical protein
MSHWVTSGLLREILSRTPSCRTSAAVPCIGPGSGPPGVDPMPGQPAPHRVDLQPAGIRSAQSARTGNCPHRRPESLGRPAALTLNRPVGAANPECSLVSVAMRAQPSRQSAKRFAHVPLLVEAAHEPKALIFQRLC